MSILLRLARILLVVLVLPLSAAAQHAPAIWEVEGEDSTVYLFGTIHLLKAETPWRTGTLDALFDRADTLVVEAAVDSVDPMAMQQQVMRLGYYPPGQSLADDLPGELHARLMAEAQKLGLPPQAVARMQPWFAGVTLAAMLAQRAGFLQQYGVEVTLLADARASGKDVRELESVTEQLEIFSSLPKAAQVSWLEKGLDEVAEIESTFEQMKEAWLAADLEALDTLLSEGLEENSALVNTLLYERNRKWVPQIGGLLAIPGIHFVAVGAGHLVGENSLVALLREAGHEVRRY